MNTNISSTKTKGETTEATYCPVAYATLFTKGLERVLEASKTSFEFAVEQNTEVLISCKKVLKASSMPGMFLFDLAGQAFERYGTLQKSLLNLSAEQSTAAVHAAQGCSHDASKAKAQITSVLQHSVDATVEAQKLIVDFAVKQTKAVSAIVKPQSGVTAKPVEAVKNAVQSAVATPAKEILMVATVKPQPSVAVKPAPAVKNAVRRVVATPAKEILMVAKKPQLSVAVKPVPAVANPVQRAITALPAKETPEVATVKPQAVIAKPVPTVEDSVQLRVDTLLAKEIVDLAIKPSKNSGPVN